MTAPEVVLREFTTEVEAAIAVAALHANHIHGEARPLSTTFGITTMAGATAVVVRAEDAVRARELLDTPFDPR